MDRRAFLKALGLGAASAAAAMTLDPESINWYPAVASRGRELEIARWRSRDNIWIFDNSMEWLSAGSSDFPFVPVH